MKIKDLYDEEYLNGYGEKIAESAILQYSALQECEKGNYQKSIATSLAGILNMMILRNIHQYNADCDEMITKQGLSAEEAEAIFSKPGYLVDRMKESFKQKFDADKPEADEE